MFFALRLALIAFYAKPLPSLDALGEWPHALLLGARFDLKIGAIVGALFSLVGLLVRPGARKISAPENPRATSGTHQRAVYFFADRHHQPVLLRVLSVADQRHYFRAV
ncbi:hypothetical protein [Paludibacterium denitrificans]|uniref:Uncharacterized protein n=1 Tax=Paludibacterium denitrificans TaxID=2675226 RepID=A0A844GBP2_9NEIS|nr:hypothetical protein [Paludibacterium denitrificans]MTD32770.1 hypothetical protein [Paludibacterium denitrificans]